MSGCLNLQMSTRISPMRLDKKISFASQRTTITSRWPTTSRKPQRRLASPYTLQKSRHNPSSSSTSSTWVPWNQTPLSIITHHTKTWIKVQNNKKVASTDAFRFLWGDHPTINIKTYAVELKKRQRAMKKLKVPCVDALKVITFVKNMHKSGIFTECKLLCWENTPALQGWTEPQDFFDTNWTHSAAFKIRLEGAHL